MDKHNDQRMNFKVKRGSAFNNYQDFNIQAPEVQVKYIFKQNSNLVEEETSDSILKDVERK